MCMKGSLRQFGFAVVISTALFSAGAAIGWSVEVGLMAQDEKKTFTLTVNDQAWLIASAGLAAIISSLIGGWMAETLGPCRLLQVILLPTAVAWIVMATANQFGWILAGRILTGCYIQFVLIAVQPLIAELSEPEIRGSLSCLPEIFFTLGMLMVLIFARFLSWQTGTLIIGILVFPVMAFFLYVPESPYWYIRKGQYKNAKRSLQKLRSKGKDVDSEMNAIKEVVVDVRNAKGTFREQINSMREPANYRPTILVAALFLLRELSGALVIFTYAPYFFSSAGVLIDAFSVTILIGVARLLFTLVSSAIIDLVGRRNLFISSSLVCTAMMFITGLVLLYPYPHMSWVPLLAVIVYVAAFGLGPGPIPWVLLGELLPTPVRSLGSSICNGIFAIVFYLEALFYPQMILEISFGRLVLLFALFNLLTVFVVWLFLPETQNRTLEDLQTAFVGATLRPFKSRREGYLQPYGTTSTARTKLIP